METIMENNMEVNNSKTMTVLLSALGFIEDKDYKQAGDKVEIYVSMNDLIYAINSTEEDVQNIFGTSDEWLELIKKIMYGK